MTRSAAPARRPSNTTLLPRSAAGRLPRPRGEQTGAASTTTLRPIEPAEQQQLAGPVAAQPAGVPLLRSVLAMVAMCCLAVILDLVVLSPLQQASAQQHLRDRIRGELANGVAPVRASDPATGAVLADGSPIGILQIPDIDVNQVVLFGSTAGVLMDGPGLRRDTPLPGQRGTSVLLGRASAYGAPFGHIAQLTTGTPLTVTTGQGIQHFTVVAVRRAGDPLPDAARSGSRLTLVTADGSAYFPNGVLRVDADLVGSPQPTAAVLPATALRPAEHALAGDTGQAGLLIFSLQALLASILASVVAWRRWGHLQAWLVGGPLVLLAGLWATNHISALLPNLL